MKRELVIVGVVAASAFAIACSQSHDEDAAIDAGDGSTGWLDANVADAAEATDAFPRHDAGALDADGDGTPDAMDCDPTNPAIASVAMRACANACGEGSESCSAGTWGACSAPTDCTCSEPGARRVTACGMCGERAEQCTDGRWSPTSACLSEGECSPATVEERARPACGLEQRICGSECNWGAWATVRPSGECEPPYSECASEVGLDVLCTDDCRLVDNPDCP